MLPGPLAVGVIIEQKKVQRPVDLCTFNVAPHASETGAAKPKWTLLWDLSVDARDVPIFGDQAWEVDQVFGSVRAFLRLGAVLFQQAFTRE